MVDMLKEELGMRKLTQHGGAQVLFKRLLRSIEKCDDMQDEMLENIDNACQGESMSPKKKIKLICNIVSEFRKKMEE